MNIAALCVSTNSVYKDLGLNCYDKKRNVRTFTGRQPVICHPPCRGWTRFGKAMKANPLPGEKDLAYFCLEKLLLNGGVFEHPFESEFAILANNLPKIKTIIVDQQWWGFWCRKRTRLLVPNHYIIPEYPFELIQHNSKEISYRNWANKDASLTILPFAEWLIKLVSINNDYCI